MSGKAKFVHWLVSPFPDIESQPMFTVLENDKGYTNRSTVSGGTLIDVYGIPLPLFPDLKTWERETQAKRRCFRCWACVKGPADADHHRENAHGEKVGVHMTFKTLSIIALMFLSVGCNKIRHITGLDRHDAEQVERNAATVIVRNLPASPAAISFYPDQINDAPANVRVFVKNGDWLTASPGAWYEIPWAHNSDSRTTEYAVISFVAQSAIVYNQPSGTPRAIVVESVPVGAYDPGRPAQ